MIAYATSWRYLHNEMYFMNYYDTFFIVLFDFWFWNTNLWLLIVDDVCFGITW